MNKLYCVRHGQTNWNIKKLMQGRTDIPINETGKRQALEIRENLDLNNIHVCICSPMKRTKMTANIIVLDDVPIIYDDLLIERSFGKLEGKVYDEKMLNLHWDYKLNYNEYEVEAIRDCMNRVKDFIKKINDTYENKNILIVSHACIIKLIHFYVNGYDENTDFLSFFPLNGKVYEYEI